MAGQVGDSQQLVFEELTPIALMTGKQYREAHRRVRQRDRLWEKVRQEEQRGNYESSAHSKYASYRIELAKFAEESLKGATGIEAYMVLDIVRDDGHRTRLQVESVSLLSGLYGLSIDGLVWSLDGRNVRKNGTLGEQSESACLSSMYIERRGLDGVWRPPVKYLETGHAL